MAQGQHQPGQKHDALIFSVLSVGLVLILELGWVIHLVEKLK